MRRDPRSASKGALAPDDVAGDVPRQRLDVQRLGPDHRFDRSSNNSGKRDMCTPFCSRERSTVYSIWAAITVWWPSCRTRTAFWTPVTPARVSDSRTSGEDACRSASRLRSSSRGYASSAVADDFYRLVSLACHDLRTPLATVQGFAKTMLRMDELDEEKRDRYLGLIDTSADELAQLLDLLSLAARIEGGRYDPVVREADSLALAPDGATGTGTIVRVDPEPVERALAALPRRGCPARGRRRDRRSTARGS